MTDVPTYFKITASLNDNEVIERIFERVSAEVATTQISILLVGNAIVPKHGTLATS